MARREQIALSAPKLRVLTKESLVEPNPALGPAAGLRPERLAERRRSNCRDECGESSCEAGQLDDITCGYNTCICKH